MTTVSKRVALAAGAGLIALGISAGVRASAQNTNQEPGVFNRMVQRGGPGGPMGRGGPGGWLEPERGGPLGILRMFGARLNLTDAQREQLKNIARARKDEWRTLGDRARTARGSLIDAVTADTIDEALIRARAADVAAVEADMAVASAHAHAEVWQILTPEQQEQARQFRAQARSRLMERRGAMRQRIEQLLGWAGWVG
jgi:Spy/CpxP family protein refolding chaperone